MPAPGGIQTPHLWIFITERHAESHLAVIVSITSLNEGKDQTVTLGREDHPFITHDSVVSYRHAKIVDCRQIEAQVTAKTVVPHTLCSATLLKLVQDGIFASDYTANKIVTFCRIALGR
jgi:hypothetical protein